MALAFTGCRTSPEKREANYLKTGQALADKKDYARAFLQFKNAAQSMPKDAEPMYRLGLLYIETGDLRNGVAALRKATELNPKHAQAQLKLAEIMTASRNKDMVEQAATRLEGIVTDSPDNAEANDTLALAEWQLGKTAEATERLEQTLQKLPSHLQSSVALARLKMAQKDLDGAIEVMQQAVASAPKSPQAALALGQLYWVAKQPDKAESEVRRALQLDPKNAPALMGMASIQVAGKRLDEAEQTYKQLAALPGNTYRHVHAVFLYRTGKRDAALAELKQIYKASPDDRQARGRVVAACVEMGKVPEAQSILADALKRNPKDSAALFQQSTLNLRAGKLTDAEVGFTQVLRLNHDWAEAHLALSQVQKAKGLTHNEREELNEALRLQPNLIAARVALARNLIAANDANSAVQLLDKAPDAQKKLAGVILERNWALLAAGSYKELQAVLDPLLRANRVPELVLQDAFLRLNEHDYSGARTAAGEVLSHDPLNARAARVVAASIAAQNPPPKAEAKLAEAAAAYPKSLPLQELLGEFYLRTGNLPAARKILDGVKTADPKSWPVDLDLADIDRRENHPDAARQRINGVLAADPRNVRAMLQLATLEESTGNGRRSIPIYRSVLDLDNANVGALNNLAYDLAMENPDEALTFAQKAAEVAPDNATVEDTLGWVYYRKGIYTSAVRYLKAAVDKEPTPRRRFHLAMSYMKSGDQAQGQQMLAAALRDDPNLPKTEQGW